MHANIIKRISPSFTCMNKSYNTSNVVTTHFYLHRTRQSVKNLHLNNVELTRDLKSQNIRAPITKFCSLHCLVLQCSITSPMQEFNTRLQLDLEEINFFLYRGVTED